MFDLMINLGASAVEGRLFIPQGRSYFRAIPSAVRGNPRPRVAPIDVDKPERSFAARLFVGLNVDGDAPMDIFTLMAIVEDVQRRKGRSASSAYIAQTGIWQTEGDASEFEDSAQVYLMAPVGVAGNPWAEGILELADAIATIAHQKIVVVQILRNSLEMATRKVKSP